MCAWEWGMYGGTSQLFAAMQLGRRIGFPGLLQYFFLDSESQHELYTLLIQL